MLSYPLAWLPVFTVVAGLVVLNAYLALLGLALVAVLTVAAVVGLAWLAALESFAVGRRLLRRLLGARRSEALDS